MRNALAFHPLSSHTPFLSLVSGHPCSLLPFWALNYMLAVVQKNSTVGREDCEKDAGKCTEQLAKLSGNAEL